MKKPIAKKKQLPPWVPIVVIAVVIIVVVVVLMRLTTGQGQMYSGKTHAIMQKKLDEGFVHRMYSAEELEAQGFKLPPNYPRASK